MAKQSVDDDLILVDETRIGTDYASHSLRNAKVDVASGGVSGALLTLGINTWVTEGSLKSTLLYAVPTAAVTIALCARFIGGIVSQLWKYAVSEIVRKYRLRKVEDGIRVALEHQTACEAEFSSTSAQKKECRDAVIRLRREKLILTVHGAVVIK